MLHRHVVLISTAPESPALARAVERLSPHLQGWSPALATELASAWVLAARPSRLSHRRLGRTGCLIGLDFPREGAGAAEETLDGLLERRWGAYLAIEVDEARRHVQVLRDPTGRIDCWRLALDGVDVLFSHYEDIQPLLPARPSIHWDYIAYHLNNDWLRGEETGLAQVLELLPGDQLTYRDGRATTTRPWRPDRIAADRFTTIGEAQHAIRTAAGEAVGAWAGQYATIALDLSGGLDSAIVLGLLRRQAGHQDLVGVNWVIAHAEGDERAFAWDAANLHGVRLIEAQITPQDRRFGAPVSHRMMRPSIRAMPLGYDEKGGEIAREVGADAYFTGTAGDHIFFDYLQINAAADYLRNRAPLGGALAAAHQLAQTSKNTIWNVAAAALADQARGPQRLHQLFKHRNPFAAGEMSRAALERFIHPWAHDGWRKTPPAKLQQILNISELQRHYWRYGRADIAEEVHPLFSQPLVEACLRTPTYWFCAGGVQRGLARRIFADLLPDSIRMRRTKGANTSHWVRVMTQNLPQIRELMLEGRLAAQGLVNRARLEEELTPLAMAAGKAQGPLAVCLTTEVWIQQMEAGLPQRAASPRLMAV